MAYEKEVKPDRTWHDSLGDLERLGQIEEQILLCYKSGLHKDMYHWLKAFYLKLYSITKFNRSDVIKKFGDVAQILNSADKNQDGTIDEFEARQMVSKLSEAMFMLEELYADLNMIKSDYGLSIDLYAHQKMKNASALLKSIDKWVDRKLFKKKGDLELIYLSKISQGYAKQ